MNVVAISRVLCVAVCVIGVGDMINGPRQLDGRSAKTVAYLHRLPGERQGGNLGLQSNWKSGQRDISKRQGFSLRISACRYLTPALDIYPTNLVCHRFVKHFLSFPYRSERLRTLSGISHAGW